MKIELWLIGKSMPYIDEAFNMYCDRLKRYLPFEVVIIPDVKKKKDPQSLKQAEGKVVLDKLQPTDHLVLLDERGKAKSSEAFAKDIEGLMMTGKKRIVYLVGGAYGFDESVYQRSNDLLSLSKMTFSHQIIRTIFMEQLYRAFTIINNEPYHHGG